MTFGKKVTAKVNILFFLNDPHIYSYQNLIKSNAHSEWVPHISTANPSTHTTEGFYEDLLRAAKRLSLNLRLVSIA